MTSISSKHMQWINRLAGIVTAIILCMTFLLQMRCHTGRNETVYRIIPGQPRLTVQDKIVILFFGYNIGSREFKESEICRDYDLLAIKETSHLGHILLFLFTGTLILMKEREFVCGEAM